jgi:hypothetical protein
MLLVFLPALYAAAAELRVDCAKVTGRLRPLHGGNCGPVENGEMIDLSAYYRELGLPFTRLHDCHWPNPDVVDIHAIFPDFKADPAKPESYDFSRTDDYIQAVVNVGSGIVYRLGESIEHTRKKYYVHPPADFDQWAAVCIGIIRHYNEGFANGFRHNIRYWEIWNEPENRPAMWTGTDDQYLRLYEIATKAIKARFPDVKVGGPSLGYSGRIVAGRFEPSPFLLQFLAHCRDRSLPLDFFSWHLYTNDPSECLIRAKALRELLDRQGFSRTELHFNEWNYLPDNDWGPMMQSGQGLARERFYDRMGGAEGAAFSACVLMNLQDSPVDVANYYRADSGGFGLFNVHGTPNKAFYVFKAFRALLDTPLRLETGGGEPGRLTICAGVNEARTQIGLLISNFRSADKNVQVRLRGLPWDGPSTCRIFMVDPARDLTEVRTLQLPAGPIILDEPLPAAAIGLIKISRQGTVP